jgi:hypothetical protein|tara:strand:+ start:323 stop:544 length:222 start_codon:yes stop_codon:yes gene_type:complete
VLKKGQLVRWVVDYAGFQADEDRVIKGIEPIYKYGIVMEVGSDSKGVVVYCYESGEINWTMLYLINDKIEVLN